MLIPIWVSIVRYLFKGALSDLRQFLTNESPLKMIKSSLYFTLKALFDLKIFKVLSWHFSHVEKRLDYKNKVNFKIYDVITWQTDNCNTRINKYLEKQGQSGNEICSINTIYITWEAFFWKNRKQNCGGETSPRSFSEKLKLSISLDQ